MIPIRQQLCACIMVTSRSEWDDHPLSVPLLEMSWRCEERGHQQPISPNIFQSLQQKAFLKDFICCCSTLKVNASVVW